VVCLALYYVRMFFVTAGYHRYFSHRSFKTSRVFQFIMALVATSSTQKGVLWWAANHRHHHKYSDTDDDLHSPSLRGFLWSHVGWILSDRYNKTRVELIPDFNKYPELRWLQKYHVVPTVVYAVAMYLKSHQSPDGQWVYPVADPRPPICSDYIGQTAVSMRALQLYAPKTDRAGYDRSIQLAAAWMAKAQSNNNEDRSYRLLGLAWAAKDKVATQKAVRELLSKQRPDGGWSDLDSMESSAFATGRALVALQTAGLAASDAACQRAVKFLLSTQQEDGSWYVRSRAMAFQPYFDAGFPHGFDQWISAAATNWATMALAQASPAPKRLATSTSAGR